MRALVWHGTQDIRCAPVPDPEIAAARAAGFDNMNLDFIFGLINQPLARWQDTARDTL